MTDETPSPIREADYAAIEAAVMETQRGRWFLAEYARRNRNSDTEQVLGAIDRLDRSLKSAAPEKLAVVDDMLASLIDMADAISRTKREIGMLSGDGNSDHFGDASIELDAVVEATESATNRILSAAERIQESAFSAMERGEAETELSEIDAAVMEIYEGCSFQDITGQRISKVVQTLRYLEGRIDAMAAAWTLTNNTSTSAESEDDATPAEPGNPDPLLNGPARPGDEIDQTEVDSLLDDFGPAEATSESVEASDDDVPETGQDDAAGDVAAHQVPDAAHGDESAAPSAEPAKDQEWRGQHVPALAVSNDADTPPVALGDLPQLTATEVDALYS